MGLISEIITLMEDIFSDLFKENKNTFKLKKPNGEIYKIDKKQNITPEKIYI